MHCLQRCLIASLLTLCLTSCSNIDETEVEDSESFVEAETPSSSGIETEAPTQVVVEASEDQDVILVGLIIDEENIMSSYDRQPGAVSYTHLTLPTKA